MSRVHRVVSASPELVWEVLSDGWLYPLWVVGASRMREVDDSWPGAGAKLHHSVGSWPLLLDDETEVLESERPSRLRLKAKGRPGGEAVVEVHVHDHMDGAAITIEEDLVSGPARLVPEPVRAPLLAWRNTETLRRLAYLVERRQQR